MKKSKNLFIVLIYGPMGAGKSTVAKLLQPQIKRTVHLSLDRIKWFISDFKRVPKDNEISRNVVISMANEYLKRNINIIQEQGMTTEYMKLFEKLAKKYKAKLFIFELNAPLDVLVKRVEERTKILDKPKMSIKKHFNKNYKLYLQNKYKKAIVLNTENKKPEDLVKIILKEVLE